MPETTFVPPQPLLVPQLMADLMRHYGEKKAALHPVALAADVHAELVGVRPFIDGNGRTSRLVMNLILLRAGFPIANISGDRAARADYYAALNASHIDGQDEPFRMLVARYVRESLFNYLAMVSGNVGEDAAGKGGYFYERMNGHGPQSRPPCRPSRRTPPTPPAANSDPWQAPASATAACTS